MLLLMQMMIMTS